MNCYGSYNPKRDTCKKCKYAKYCIDAGDPTINSDFEYDDSRSTALTQEKPPDIDLGSAPISYFTSADFLQAIHSMLSIRNRNKIRFDIMTLWIIDHAGRPAKGRDGMVKDIAKKLNIHSRTVMRNIQAIGADPVLGKVFRYKNCRKGNRAIDKGTNKPVRDTCWVQPEFVLVP